MIDDDMRGLTVRQPHASAIVAGIKDIENRNWFFPLPFGTTIAIHSGKKVDPDGLHMPDAAALLPDSLPRGLIIGVVDVVDIGYGRNFARPGKWSNPDYDWHWILQNARALRNPIPCTGRQTLFRLGESTIAEIRAQLQDENLSPP